MNHTKNTPMAPTEDTHVLRKNLLGMRSSRLVGNTLVYVVLALGLVMVLAPFLMMFLNSFKNTRESALFKISWSATSSLDNYRGIISNKSFWRGMGNSLLITISTVLVTNTAAAMGAFFIQRMGNRLAKTAYFLFFAGLVVPISIIPTIKVMQWLQLHNTYPGIVLFYTATNMPFTIFLLTGFMKSVPRELDEAALIEGSSYFRLFTQIIVPLLITPLITSSIVITTNVWNDFFAPFYLISSTKKQPIVISIHRFVSMYGTDWGVVFAFMVMVIAPVLLIYAFLQRYIIDGLTSGSLKG